MDIIQSPSLGSGAGSKFASEVKYVVSLELAEEIRTWSRENMQPDPNGSGNAGDNYTITSIYLDTEDFAVLQRKGSFGKGKYRIRRYGESPQVFLERKLKTRGLISKRRSQISMGDLLRIAADEPESDWQGYWYHRRILARRLRPVCQISYQRTARMLMSPSGPLRLTLDEQVTAVPTDQIEFQNVAPTPLTIGGVIVELKYRQQMPALFEELVQRLGLKPQPSSKYRIACATLGLGVLRQSTIVEAA